MMRHNLPCLLLVMMLGLTGCATTKTSAGDGADGVILTLTPSGAILLEGKASDLDHLARRLRSSGATPDTPITIDIAAETPLATVSSIASRLASAGYRKILFRRPKHAAASSQSARPPSPLPTAPPPRP